LNGCKTYSFTLREENTFRLFENKMQRKIFEEKSEELKYRPIKMSINLGARLKNKIHRVINFIVFIIERITETSTAISIHCRGRHSAPCMGMKIKGRALFVTGREGL
jgi:hypothetical protein